ncbi:MAG: hypothetical protein LQ352_002580 [Teloschistes flavicans]|nr:MAG: hypothetical protein LQ352_002580 [Teloschistes flavicans]
MARLSKTAAITKRQVGGKKARRGKSRVEAHRLAPLAIATTSSSTRSHATEVSPTLPATSVDSLQELCSDATLDRIKTASDIDTALQLARDTIQQLTLVTTDVASQAALAVEDIWNHFKHCGKLRREHGLQIERWQKGVQQDFAVDRFLSMAVSTRRKVDAKKAVIQKHWGVPAVEVLAHQQTVSVVLSRPLLEDLADLCQVVSLDQGRDLMQQAIETRKHDKKGPVTATDDRLRRRDVKRAIEQVPAKPKKRKPATKVNQKSSRRRTASPPPKNQKSDKKSSIPQKESPAIRSDSLATASSHEDQTQSSQPDLDTAEPAAGEGSNLGTGKDFSDLQTISEESSPDSDEQKRSATYALQRKSAESSQSPANDVDGSVTANSVSSKESYTKSGKGRASPASDNSAKPPQTLIKVIEKGRQGELEAKHRERLSESILSIPSPSSHINDTQTEQSQSRAKSVGLPEDTSSEGTPHERVSHSQPVTPLLKPHKSHSVKSAEFTATTPSPSTPVNDMLMVHGLMSLKTGRHSDSAKHRALDDSEAPSVEIGRRQPLGLNDLSSVGQDDPESPDLTISLPSPYFQSTPPLPESKADGRSRPSHAVLSSSPLVKHDVDRRWLASSSSGSPTTTPPPLSSLDLEESKLQPALLPNQQELSAIIEEPEPEQQAVKYNEQVSESVDSTLSTRSGMQLRRRDGVQASDLHRQRELPPTTTAGALSSLEPGQWVSATAIEMVLKAIKPDDWLLVDSAWVSPAKIGPFIAKHPGCNTRLWIPVHSGKHWMLMAVHFDDQEVHIYNSLPQCEKDLSELYNAIVSPLDMDNQWTRRNHDEWKQSNDFDCGVYLLIAAFCNIAQSPLPSEVSSLRWRRLMGCFVDPSAVDTDNQQKQAVARPFPQKQPVLVDEVSNITNAAAIVRQQRWNHNAILTKKVAEQRDQLSAYDNLSHYLTSCGIEVGLPHILLGVKAGREQLERTMSQTKDRQSEVEQSIRAWDMVGRMLTHEREKQSISQA